MEQDNKNPNQNKIVQVQNAKTPLTDVNKYIKQKYLKVLIIAIAITIILGGLLFIYTKSLMLIIYPLFALIFFYSFIKQKADGLPGNLDGSLFFIGHSPAGRDVVSGIFENTPFVIFNYRYIIGGGKNSQTYIYTVFRLDYPSSFPSIFLKSKDCMFGGFLFGDISGKARERIKLEGDFDKHFDLWAEKGFEIEVLQVFTPDFMSKVEDNWKKFGLEFINNQIYIYSHHMITKDEELENMYQFIQYLVSEINPLAKEMKGDINALNEYYKQ